MDREEYVLGNIFHLNKISGRIIDKHGNAEHIPFSGFEKLDPVLNNEILFEKLIKAGNRGRQKKYVVYDDNGFLYYVYCEAEYYIIWGPVTLENKSVYEQHLYEKSNNVNAAMDIPLICDIQKMEEIVMFAHGLLKQEYENSVTIEYIENEQKKQHEFMADLSEYRLSNAENAKNHYSFAEEDHMWKLILSGDELSEFHKKSQHLVDSIVEGIGTMSELQKKEAEYKIVSAITLLTRYAIMSGVNDEEAYALSDVSLQRLSKKSSVIEMEEVFKQAVTRFIELNRQNLKNKKNHSVYVEQSREYIAKHIYEKISVTEIASNVGLHPTYLSKIFSEEMGMSIMKYIMNEKINISCNLLKYSDRSISTVAEYINLAPQSYFTKVFKNVMGQTPAKYRKTHFDVNFIQ